MGKSGFSKDGLARMRATLAGYVERGALPGLVSAVSRHGEVQVEVMGSATLAGAPMRRDTLFRIASLSKAVTAVAALILVEECKLRLDDPVDHFLPELADRKVLARIDAPLDDTVPAQRPITLRDLLTLRLGLGYLMIETGDYPIQQALAAHGLLQGPPQPDSVPAPDEWMRRAGALPLMYQPGDKWLYDFGIDTTGVLIARAAGKPLGEFMRERIFAPLGMRDTGFHVPKDKLDRLATSYLPDPAKGVFTVYDPVEGQWSRPPAFPSGSGGLVSTIDDYLAFAHMLLGHGTLGRERILSRASVLLMTTDQLTGEQRDANPLFFSGNSGWGFGVSVINKRDNLWATPGHYGWTGGLGTTWGNDPQENLAGLLFTQRMMDSPQPPAFFTDFWTSAYQALAD